jgi:hypothetical protein
MTIPASEIVNVLPGVLSAAGSAIDMNGVLLTHNNLAPIGANVSFANADAVAAYFGPTSDEYNAAVIYFNGYNNCTKTPGRLYFAQYNDAPVAAYVRGGSLKSMSLDDLKLLSGTIIVTIDGTVHTSTAINLSAATSFSNAAELMSTALSETVSYNPTTYSFVIGSGTVGTSSTIGYASGTLSPLIKLTQETGAVLSQGAAAATPSAFMQAYALNNQNWGGFGTMFEPVLADKIAFSAWTSGTHERFAYVGWDTDIKAEQSGSTGTWGEALETNDYSGSFPVYGDLTHAVFVLGTMASIDFDRLNGRITFAFRAQDGLEPSVTDATVAQNLIDNGYNYYGAYATAKENWNFIYPGSVSGKFKWFDSYVNQIWLNANLQLADMTLLVSAGSIPYNADGYAMLEAAKLDPINAAINFGAIRTGVALSTSQKQQIQNAIGKDVSQVITTQGYYLEIKPATAAIRVDRDSPSQTLYYTDGGSVQKLTLASIEVQ